MDATDFDQVWLSAIVESGQRHRNPLPDEGEREFTPAAGHLPYWAVYSIRPVATASVHSSRNCPALHDVIMLSPLLITWIQFRTVMAGFIQWRFQIVANNVLAAATKDIHHPCMACQPVEPRLPQLASE